MCHPYSDSTTPITRVKTDKGSFFRFFRRKEETNFEIASIFEIGLLIEAGFFIGWEDTDADADAGADPSPTSCPASSLN